MSLDYHKIVPVEALFPPMRRKMKNVRLLPTVLTTSGIVVDGLNHAVMNRWPIQIGLLTTRQGSNLRSISMMSSSNGWRTSCPLKIGVYFVSFICPRSFPSVIGQYRAGSTMNHEVVDRLILFFQLGASVDTVM